MNDVFRGCTLPVLMPAQRGDIRMMFPAANVGGERDLPLYVAGGWRDWGERAQQKFWYGRRRAERQVGVYT